MSLVPFGFGMDPFGGMGGGLGMGGFGGLRLGGMGGGGMLGFPGTSTALAPFGDVDRQLLDFSRLAADPLPVDVEEKDNAYLVRVHQREAGLRKKDLRVDVENGQLIIRGEREREKGDERRGTYRREYRSVSRVMVLPFNVEQDKVEARYEGNQLVIHLPKKPGTEGQRRSIDISGAGAGEEKQGAGTTGAGMGTTAGAAGAGTSGGMGTSTSDAGTHRQHTQQGTSTR